MSARVSLLAEAVRAHDEVASVSPIVREAEAVFHRLSPYPGDGLIHHCRRLYRFALLLLEHEGVEVPRDIVYLVAVTHDLGLVTNRSLGPNYVFRSHRLAGEILETVGEGDGYRADVAEALLHHQRVFEPRGLGPLARAFRRAIRMDHSYGWIRYGLDRARVRSIFREYPRENLSRVLVDFYWRILRYEPLEVFRGSFFGDHPGV